MCVCVCVCVSKISETTKYKALKKAKKLKFLCCAGLAGYVIANCFTAAKVRHLFRIGKKTLKKCRYYNHPGFIISTFIILKEKKEREYIQDTDV